MSPGCPLAAGRRARDRVGEKASHRGGLTGQHGVGPMEEEPSEDGAEGDGGRVPFERSWDLTLGSKSPTVGSGSRFGPCKL